MIITHENKKYEIPDEVLAKHEVTVEGGKPRRAEWMEEYWSVNSGGTISSIPEINDEFDDYYYLTGNYFRTKEEAEKSRALALALGRVTHRILELNGDWVADWSDDSQVKMFLEFNWACREFNVTHRRFSDVGTKIPYMETEEIANAIIVECDRDLEVIFGVK